MYKIFFVFKQLKSSNFSILEIFFLLLVLIIFFRLFKFVEYIYVLQTPGLQ